MGGAVRQMSALLLEHGQAQYIWLQPCRYNQALLIIAILTHLARP